MYTSAIVDSHNVSSITDNGAGDFTITFSNNMATANYAHFADCYDANQNASLLVAHTTGADGGGRNVGDAGVMGQLINGTASDVGDVNYLLFGD
jgi:hypothetical protein